MMDIFWLRFQLYFIRNWAEILTCTDLRVIWHLQLTVIQNAGGETIRQLFQMSRTAYLDTTGICICGKAQKPNKGTNLSMHLYKGKLCRFIRHFCGSIYNI